MSVHFSRLSMVLFLLGCICISCNKKDSPNTDTVINLYKNWKWEEMPSLKDVRELPRLVQLDQGILVVGGGSELRETAMSSTEIFNLKTKTWEKGPELLTPIRDAEVLKLNDGRIIAIGGSSGKLRTGTTNVQILDLKENRWSAVPSMKYPRIGHTATLLKDGRVLVIGGQAKPDEYLQTCEIFSPDKNTWEEISKMNEVRSLHHSRLLPSGKVLVIGGGTDETATCTTEIFDSETNTWKYSGMLKEPRWGFASAILDDGKILIAGGRVPAIKGATLPDDQLVLLSGAEIFDPKTEQWKSTNSMNIPRSMGLPNVNLTKLPNGGYLFMGGRSYPRPYHGVNSAEYFDPKTEKWVMVSSMKNGRSYQANILLPNGEILVVGGRGRDFLPLNGVECFEPIKK